MERKNPYEPSVAPLLNAIASEERSNESLGRTVLRILMLGGFFLAGAIVSTTAVQQFEFSRISFIEWYLFCGDAISLSFCGISYIVSRIFFQTSPASSWIRMIAFVAGISGPITGFFIYWYRQ